MFGLGDDILPQGERPTFISIALYQVCIFRSMMLKITIKHIGLNIAEEPISECVCKMSVMSIEPELSGLTIFIIMPLGRTASILMVPCDHHSTVVSWDIMGDPPSWNPRDHHSAIVSWDIMGDPPS